MLADTPFKHWHTLFKQTNQGQVRECQISRFNGNPFSMIYKNSNSLNGCISLKLEKSFRGVDEVSRGRLTAFLFNNLCLMTGFDDLFLYFKTKLVMNFSLSQTRFFVWFFAVENINIV